jgi:hypothetical protein
MESDELFITKSEVIGWWRVNKIILNPKTEISTQQSVSHESASAIATRVRKEILNLKNRFYAADGTVVDYEAMSVSEDLKRYEISVSALQDIDLTLLSENARKALFINIYNSLTIHALARKHLTSHSSLSTIKRLRFYATCSYIIGRAAYCLNDIENGVLRGNKASPVPFTSAPLGSVEVDPRTGFLITKFDPRIHFALNCGARSCPPIAVYSFEDSALEKQLQTATEVFLEATVAVESSPRAVFVRVSQLFNWYKNDFGSTDRAVVEWIATHASDELKQRLKTVLSTSEAIILVFDEYKWDINSS